MKRLTKKMLSLLLVISMLAVHFITPINVFADEQVTITIDVNGGNELLESTITGPKGNSLYEIAMAQEEGWYLSFERTPKPRTYLRGFANSLTDEDINPMDPINEDLGVKLLWGNAQLYSDDIEIEAEPPMVGEDYSLHDEQAENLIAITVQDPTPLIGGDGLDFDVFDVPFENRMFMVRTCNDPINENACLVPFEGTIQQGQTYYLGFYIKINENYYMTNDITEVLTVNGEEPVLFDEVRTFENGDFDGAWVYVEMSPASGQFTIEFDTDGGTNIAPVQLNDGELVQRPEDPEKDNFIFAGWYSDEERTQEYDFNDPVHEPRTIYAKWEAKNISINANPASIDFGEVQVNPEEYIQRAVTITNDGNTKITLGVSSPTGDGPFGTLSFNPIDLDPGASEIVTVVINKNAAQAAEAGEYSGNYVFTATEYGKENSTSINVHASVTMVSEAPATHTVTFNTDGGTQIDPVVVNHGASVDRPAQNPQKENYEFDTWCADATKTQPYDFSNSITSDITIYARYNEVQQGGGNDPQDLDVSIVPMVVEFGTFNIGSNEDLTQDVTINNNSNVAINVTVTVPTNDGPFNIHAESNTFMIGAKDSANLTLSVDNAAQQASVAGTYNGQFVFDYSPVGEQLGDSISVAANVTVAEPPVEKVTVTFNTDGGTPVPDAVEIDKGTAVTRPAQNPQKENYEFDTWCSDSTKTQVYDFSQPVNGNITLYARYTETQQGGGNDPAPAAVVVTPNEVDFGTFYIGSDSDINRTVTITNGGNTDVEVLISSPTAQGPFNALEINAFTIEAGQTEYAHLMVDHGAQQANVAGTYNGQYVFTYHVVGEQDEQEALVSASVTVAEPDVEKVTVTFNTDGGTPVPDAVEIDKGTAVTRPAQDPQKENYEFDTWCSDSTKTQVYDFSQPVNGNITLYARYNEIQQGGNEPEVSISIVPMVVEFGTFNIGATEDLVQSATVTNNSDIAVEVEITIPTATGPFNIHSESNTFTIPAHGQTTVELSIDHGAQQASVAGEYNGQYVFAYNAVGEQLGDSISVAANVTVAEPPVEKVTVTFNTDGGTPVPDAVEIDKGTAVTRPAQDPQKENYEFDTWCSDSTKTQVYDFSQPVNGNITLYARYTAIPQPAELNVTVNPNSAQFGTFYIGSNEDLTQDVVVSNESEVAVEVTVASPSNEGPFNIHAESNTFTIAAGEQHTITLSVDHAAQKAGVAGTYNGQYVFSYNEVGTQNGDEALVSASVTVAEPPVEKVTVTFNTDGGTPVPDAVELDKGTAVTRPAQDPQKENYEFDTWCSDSNKTQVYDFSQPVNGNITLYARYTAIPQPAVLDVTVNPNDVDFGTFYVGSNEDLTQDVIVTNESEVAVEVTVASPSNEGPFDVISPNSFTIAAGEQHTVTLFVDPEAQKAGVAGTYNGQYVFSYNEVGTQNDGEALVTVTVTVEQPPVEKVTVTFNTDGGTPVPDAVEIDKGTAVTRPAQDPQKENYEFDTWCSDSTKTQVYDFSQPVNGNITLYARYTEASEPELEILDNTNNQNYDPEGDDADDGLTIKVSGELPDLIKIEVDGVEITDNDVQLTSGSTIATFTPEFLSSLASGTHTVKFYFGAGNIEATFTIGADTTQTTNPTTNNNPGTFDDISNWFELLGISVLLTLSGVVVLKKNHN